MRDLLAGLSALALLAPLAGCGGAKKDDSTPPGPGCRGGLAPTRAIGNWDVVPYQRFAGTFEVGVVGFHEEGIDVAFAVNGEPLGRVAEPTRNPRTGVWEYWVALEAGSYPDGPVTVTATLEPDCPGHLSRELAPLTLYANAGGSLGSDAVLRVDCATGDDEAGDGSPAAPYRTIERAFTLVGDGGTVELAAGTCYVLTNDLPAAGYTYWTTVQPAPGVGRDAVDILTSDASGLSTGRFGEDRVRWRNVRLHKDEAPGYSTLFYLESGHAVWFDGAELYDARGQWNGGQPLNGNDPWEAYYTGAYIHDLQNAPHRFGRDLVLENIGSDVFRGASGLLSVNLVVYGIDAGATDAHPDFFQFYNPDDTVENVVVYNARVYDMGAQGIFGGPGAMRDVAFVNLLMEKDPADSALTSQITGSWDHVLLWHVTTVDAGFFLRETAQLRNFFIQNGLYHTLHAGDATALPGFTIEGNHVATLVWDQPEPMGIGASVGDPGFADVATDDYHLAPGSPAVGGGAPLPGVPVDVEGTPYDAEAPALGCFAH